MEDVHKGHRNRMIERFKREGAKNFYDHELIEMILYYCFTRQDTNKLAHNLLKEFKGVKGFLEADYDSLLQVKGIGEKSAVLLSLIGELSNRKNNLSLVDKNHKINTVEEAKDYCAIIFHKAKYERFHLICLKDSGQVIDPGFICEGHFNKVNVNMRKIMDVVVKHQPSGVILAHNHPNGEAFPSEDDLNTTVLIKEWLEPLQVKVLDHIICGDKESLSFAQHGLLGVKSNKTKMENPGVLAVVSDIRYN